MRCHYDVLGLPLTATTDEIKKAYRKCALQWHPDKHPENKEEANKRFLEVQDAYETLSNDQERAWYDSHREVLINGGVPGETDESKFIFNIYPYFSSSCFRGFDDNDEKSFYSVYGDMFAQIAEEDAPHYEQETEIPKFGKSDSDYEEVVGPFYAFWMSYCTPRSFVWIEKHDTREANDRQVRRLMEKENKKLRDKAKKERNEEIRKLVAFIRKKDPRVEQYKKVLEEKALLAQKKAQEKKEADRLRRAELIKNYVQPDWSNVDDQLNNLDLDENPGGKSRGNRSPDAGENEENSNSNEEDVDEDESDFDESLYCVACDKSFKSVKSFSNHEKSKKHKENIEILKRHMKEEDASLFNDSKINGNDEEEDGEESTEGQEIESQTRTRLSKKQKKKRKQNKANMNLNEESDEEEDQVEASEDAAADDEDQKAENQVTQSSEDVVTSNQNQSDDETEAPKKIPKGKNKKANKEKAVPPTEKGSENKPKLLKCTVCNQEFDTRNKLFQHISAEGHTANKLEVNAVTAAVALEAGVDLEGQPLSHNAIKRNKRLAKLANKK